MNRKEFIQSCAFTCLGLTGISAFNGCAPAKYLQIGPSENVLKIKRSEFYSKNKSARVLIIKAENLNYPIALYRFSDSDYSALLLQCTHQGNELTVNGDMVACHAHGSEFSNKGDIIQGPAEQRLKAFIISTDAQNIFIHLT